MVVNEQRYSWAIWISVLKKLFESRSFTINDLDTLIEPYSSLREHVWIQTSTSFLIEPTHEHVYEKNLHTNILDFFCYCNIMLIAFMELKLLHIIDLTSYNWAFCEYGANSSLNYTLSSFTWPRSSSLNQVWKKLESSQSKPKLRSSIGLIEFVYTPTVLPIIELLNDA